MFAEQAQALREELETALRDDLPRHAEAIVRWLAASASALGQWLEEDVARRTRINRRLRLLALRTVLPRRAEIGAYIAAVVDNWDTATLVNRLELQVGKGPAIYPDQWDAGRRTRRALDLHPVARVRRMNPRLLQAYRRATARIA